jgi:hypothetical protein
VAGHYHQWIRILEDSRRQLRVVDMPTSTPLPFGWLRQRQELEHRAADAACEEFALTRAWPPVRTDAIVAQLHLRLDSAVSLCRTLGPQPVPSGLTGRQLLRSLLLDYWHGRLERLTSTPSATTAPSSFGGNGSKPGPLHQLYAGPGFNITIAS